MDPDTIIGAIYLTASSIGFLALWKMRQQRKRLNRMARQQAARHNDYLSNLKIS